MIDNEIIKALECCMKTEFISDCAKCEMLAFDCKDTLIENALNLINRQKAEIESLKHRKTELQIRNQELQHEKSEAIKEFAERLKKLDVNTRMLYSSVVYELGEDDIDTLVKEMTELQTNQRKEDEGK